MSTDDARWRDDLSRVRPVHTYPPSYLPGQSWALDEAWGILDTLTPGAIPDDVRIVLAGMIWGTLVRLALAGQIAAPPQEDTP